MRFAAHERYMSHVAVCPTCRGDGLCLEGRNLLNASRTEEGAPPSPVGPQAKPQPASGPEEDDEDDDHDEDPAHPHSCGTVVGGYAASGGTCRAGWSVKVQMVTDPGATVEEVARRNLDIRAALINMCQVYGIPIVQVPTPTQEPPKP